MRRNKFDPGNVSLVMLPLADRSVVTAMSGQYAEFSFEETAGEHCRAL
jgi:hypothetical protein